MSTAAARPQITVFGGDKKQVATPAVCFAPIRPDIIHFVHTNMAKNKRQPYAVNIDAGMQHSAHSWGTGRAVARIPRVSGGGTSRAGQAAFGNMCRKGRMFGPTKTWRKWHRKINVNQKRFAVASAIAASSLAALVEGRGHRISQVPEIPLVVSSSTESLMTTKKAVELLKSVGAFEDVQKAKDSKKLRAGKGKMRNRRHVARRGPLVVYNNDQGVVKAFRNLPGVELCQVERLNLLQLAPGGHVGRFIVWTEGAFARLDEIWGSTRRESETKAGYKLPQNIMYNTDITRIINSDAVQSAVRPAKRGQRRARLKKNPLKNLGVMVSLNPYALAYRRSVLVSEHARKQAKQAALEARRKGKAVPVSKKDANRAKVAKARRKTESKAVYDRMISE